MITDTDSADRAAAQAALNAAPTLDGLLGAIRRLPREVAADLDLSSLPTYGGEELANTSGVWSWDAERLLVGTHVGQPDERGAMRIVARAEWDGRP